MDTKRISADRDCLHTGPRGGGIFSWPGPKEDDIVCNIRKVCRGNSD